MASKFGRLLRSIILPNRLAGRDLQGNKFYERPSTTSDPRRTRRTIEYHDKETMNDYIGGPRRIPVQWSAWLSHTRLDPPTLEELEADMSRQYRLKQNVARIEIRDREDSERRRLGLPAPDPDAEIPAVAALEVETYMPEEAKHGDLPKMASAPDYKPESWQPNARLRGE